MNAAVATAGPRAGPLVSCIVPVYNGERFITDALDSIHAQTHAHLEIIVVDDGSTDGTSERLAAYSAAPIRVVPQENAGPAAARNAGIAIATGAFVAFLDSDDLWRPEKLDRQLDLFVKRPELGVCFAGMRNVAADPPRANDPLLNAEAWPELPFSPCTLLARRAVFDEIGLFNPALRRGEDTEWFIRLMLRKVPYEVMPDVLLDRRIHGANLSREEPPKPQNVLEVLKLVLDRRRAEQW